MITGETPPTTLVQVKFSPHGLVFLASSQLTMNYDHCIVPAGQTQQIVYLAPGHQVLEHEHSKDDQLKHAVRAFIDHFSSYAVAY